jgi:hypothetical protein
MNRKQCANSDINKWSLYSQTTNIQSEHVVKNSYGLVDRAEGVQLSVR